VFFEKISDDFLHELQWGLTGFIDPDPQATLKSPVQIFGNPQFQFNQCWLIRVIGLI
jgi:hypothetical protein